ncbi:MAG: hypothetical protein KIT18_11860 [Burkholderiales bacterium]|nr:hypothetical protein [Burkholderiales bacterium]
MTRNCSALRARCITAGSSPRWRRALSAATPKANGLTVLGPAPAPIAILRGRHRRRFLVKAARDTRIQDWIADWLAKVQVPASVRVQVDIDPYSFM